VSSGIYVATAGAVAQSNALDATANNIANASTAGFHGDKLTFREALSKARSPDVALVSAGTARVDTEAGVMQETGNPLDCALEGDGYFAVNTPSGTRYTRAGNFQLDANGTLVTSEGNAVRGADGKPITLPTNAANFGIAPDGTVSADGVAVGQLELVKFAPNQMQRAGGSLFTASGKPAAGDPPTVRNGLVEGSNINVVRGVVDLVKVSRTYESLMKVIQGYHDVEQRAARELGGAK
jgi:flagellar basal-body rod protein FlgF